MRALVVDGYNVIFRTAYLEQMADKDLMASRTEITNIARDYQRKIGGIDMVKVVFDGQDKYRGNNTSSYQKYSRTGQGDIEIIRTVEKLSKRYDVTVVSNDNFVINNARAHGASVVTVEELLEQSKMSPPKSRSLNVKAPQNVDKKVSEKKAKQINKDLMKEWGL